MQTHSVLATMGLVATAAAAAAGTGTAPVAVLPSSGVYPPGYNGTGIYTVTTVWDSVSTYCPEPTTLCFNDRTYTIDKPTTLIISDCPCTQTYTTQYTDGPQYTSYVMPKPPAQTAGVGAPVNPGATPTAPGQRPGGTAAVVVTAGAEKHAAPVIALVAGVVAAFAL
ncbi:hypothetical protein CGRA01v4_02805 [Colletotrichum graminicola]|uniref:Mmc protein n=1 Tax=Colletotrichum graminicola (strain M1.001 / M2 / FGSC 10212) TaxID=645133 RepID=E3QA93_COLGM|nr:uncharacterized protein GLRG_02925 [Colletotrichum graminicola M1.001]EFQ27781.1 hypothetical protein GLRG_02925 [Colletotrichum graminicola M1.001]WDK11526.1 hypothetical protein CGRA01v4_02805 [Colletotrichum graminicola]